MLDHVFLTVSDIERSVAFYEAVLPHLGILARHNYDGKDGPAGHPDLKGFGANGRMFFWLKQGVPHAEAVHLGFIAHNKAEVHAAYDAAIVHGATIHHAAGGAPGSRLHYDPNYYAANLLDPDGYSLEFVYKNWQHKE
ncbi:VOC family protein [uncultured Tolumonas sp.]|uniref:VOC family protein n=1 Tax=uncultured Tolumonas sp. TaxID=263765 RepID=UPI002931C59F|nr:VOC family protein [uncultured Tolumonas sp.]